MDEDEAVAEGVFEASGPVGAFLREARGRVEPPALVVPGEMDPPGRRRGPDLDLRAVELHGDLVREPVPRPEKRRALPRPSPKAGDRSPVLDTFSVVPLNALPASSRSTAIRL